MLKGLTAQVLLRRAPCEEEHRRHPCRRGRLASSPCNGRVTWARGEERVLAITAATTLVLGSGDLNAVRDHGGRGADVVYDSVGKDTFFASLDCLKPLGLMVSFGNASGPVPPVQPLELAKRGSLFLTRPILFHYIARRTDLDRAARELFEVIGRGVVRIQIGQTYALQDVAQAHRDVESRRTIGSTVLIP
jgi:NADPH:quinone reductase-like Zn-dependent oxidoreductase